MSCFGGKKSKKRNKARRKYLKIKSRRRGEIKYLRTRAKQ
jgi:hypothetical protein